MSEPRSEVIARLFRESGGARLGLSEADFAVALERSTSARDENAEPEAPDRLRVEDLALARACELGMAAAWEHFMAEYRPRLYAAARAIARDDSSGREIADSLYAELYGLEERDGARRSLFAYYHGRSSLLGWLRALIARRHVDLIRRTRRSTSLDDSAAPLVIDPTTAADGGDPDRPRYLACLQAALMGSIMSLSHRDRLRLSLYHLQELTLARIGRALGEHESTVSRKLDRSRTKLRRMIEKTLRRNYGLDAEQIRLCFEYAAEDWPYELTLLPSMNGAAEGKKQARARSTIGKALETRVGNEE